MQYSRIQQRTQPPLLKQIACPTGIQGNLGSALKICWHRKISRSSGSWWSETFKWVWILIQIGSCEVAYRKCWNLQHPSLVSIMSPAGFCKEKPWAARHAQEPCKQPCLEGHSGPEQGPARSGYHGSTWMREEAGLPQLLHLQEIADSKGMSSVWIK